MFGAIMDILVDTMLYVPGSTLVSVDINLLPNDIVRMTMILSDTSLGDYGMVITRLPLLK